MKDMNVPKLTSADLPLFNGIMLDLFPGVEVAAVDYTVVKMAYLLFSVMATNAFTCILHYLIITLVWERFFPLIKGGLKALY